MHVCSDDVCVCVCVDMNRHLRCLAYNVTAVCGHVAICDKFVDSQVQISASFTVPPFPQISGCGIAGMLERHQSPNLALAHAH
jgi:hypothetical protein